MNFINELFFGTGIAHSVFIIAIIVAIGVYLGKIKIFGISLGVTCIIYRNTFWTFRLHRR